MLPRYFTVFSPSYYAAGRVAIRDEYAKVCYTFAYMEDRRKTIAALTIIIGVIVLVVVIIGALVSRKKVVSPVPDEGAIRVIFMSPTPILIATDTPTPTTGKPSVTAKPTVKPQSTATPASKQSPTPTIGTTTPTITPTRTPTATPSPAP